MSNGQKAAIHCIRNERLWVHRACHVPALVVVAVEGLEVDVLRVGRDSGGTRQVADAHAHPLRASVPTLDAVVIHPLRRARELEQIVESELQGTTNRARDFEFPHTAGAFIPHGDGV